MEHSQDTSEWVFDYVMELLHSPTWQVPIMEFIDENCASFDSSDENKFIYTEIHEQFRELVESILCSNLTELGITAAEFAEICMRSSKPSDLNTQMDLVQQILAMDNFLTFKKIMVKRNLELELEAIQALREEYLDARHEDDDSQLVEASILLKQQEAEFAELESAIAMSIALQEEKYCLASMNAKSVEDKSSIEISEKTQDQTLESVHQGVRESKKRAEEIFLRNREDLEEKRSEQKKLEMSEIPEHEIRKREQYLRKQRDRILEKKKMERQQQIKDFRNQQHENVSKMPELRTISSVQDQREMKSSGVDCDQGAVRIAIARKMKQELLESSALRGMLNSKQILQIDELHQAMKHT